jgi:hypothetical protein
MIGKDVEGKEIGRLNCIHAFFWRKRKATRTVRIR